MHKSDSHTHKLGHRCCCGLSPSFISGIAFAIIAILHLVRSIAGWPVIIGDQAIPVWASIICVVVAGALAAWNFCTSCCKKCRNGTCGRTLQKAPNNFSQPNH